MTIEEVREYFESIGVKEGDELISAFDIEDIIPKGWKYSDFEADLNGDVSSIKPIIQFGSSMLYAFLYYSIKEQFAKPIK